MGTVPKFRDCRFPRDRLGYSSSLRRLLLAIFEYGRINLQDDTENSTAADVAAHFDASAVLSDNVLRHPQTKPGALFSGREKRIEDAREVVFGDADAAIA